MNQIAKALSSYLLCTIGLFSASSFAHATTISWQVSIAPYVGIAAQGLHLGLPPGQGGTVLKKNFAQANIFAGIRLSDYVGLEAGYETTPNKWKLTAVPGGTSILGVPTSTSPNSSPTFQLSKSQVRDWHASLLGFLPVSEVYPIKLIGSVGITRMSLHYFNYRLEDPSNLTNPFTTTSTFHATKSILRLGIGGQYALNDYVGVRVLMGWQNTSKFGAIAAKQNANNKIVPNNAWNYGVGFFVGF